jgi:acyl-CoA thioesterase I
VRGKLTLALGALIVLLAAGSAAAGSGLLAGSSTHGPSGQEQPAQADGADRPVLAVVGASFSAGVGAGSPRKAWPEDLGRLLGWRAVVSADPGAGYVNPGERHRGPFSRLAARLDLAALDPKVVIIQGGHDDIGQPLSLVRDRVESLLHQIHREAPRALLVVLTVFTRGSRPSRAAYATDRTIVAAARRAEPGILVLDPLVGHWHFTRVADRLHPTAAGHRVIARRIAAALRERLRAGWQPVRARRIH